MKKVFIGAFIALYAATFVGCGNSTPKADLKNDVDTLSYAMGRECRCRQWHRCPSQCGLDQ